MLINTSDYLYVERNKSRHGKVRYYFRAPGFPRVRLPDPYMHFDDFVGSHSALLQKFGAIDGHINDANGPLVNGTEDGLEHLLSVRDFERLISGCRSRAAKKSVPFSLSTSWAYNRFKAQNGKCAISGIDMLPPSDGLARSPYQASIDREKPADGYTEENCRMVILAVNLGMNIWGEKEFKKLAHRIAVMTLLTAK